MRGVAFFLTFSVALGAVAIQPADADTILAEGVSSGTSFLGIPTINHAGSAADFYGGGSGPEFTDFVGAGPILKSDLLQSTAHLFFVNTNAGTTNDLAMFVVYRGNLTADTATAELDSSTGDFVFTDFLAFDGPIANDIYEVVEGDLETEHTIPDLGNTDGYAANIDGKFEEIGDILDFHLSVPSSQITQLVVYGGETGSGNPHWLVLSSSLDDFAIGVDARFTIVPLPSAAWMAIPLLGCVVMKRRMRAA